MGKCCVNICHSVWYAYVCVIKVYIVPVVYSICVNWENNPSVSVVPSKEVDSNQCQQAFISVNCSYARCDICVGDHMIQ